MTKWGDMEPLRPDVSWDVDFTPAEYQQALFEMAAKLTTERRQSQRAMLGMGAVILIELGVIMWAVTR